MTRMAVSEWEGGRPGQAHSALCVPPRVWQRQCEARGSCKGRPRATDSPPAAIRALRPVCSAWNSSRAMNSRLADAHWAQHTSASRIAAAAFILRHGQGGTAAAVSTGGAAPAACPALLRRSIAPMSHGARRRRGGPAGAGWGAGRPAVGHQAMTAPPRRSRPPPPPPQPPQAAQHCMARLWLRCGGAGRGPLAWDATNQQVGVWGGGLRGAGASRKECQGECGGGRGQ